MRITDFPSSRSLRNRAIARSVSRMPMAEVGSSNTRMSWGKHIARAMASACRCPPDMPETFWSTSGMSMPRESSSSRERRRIARRSRKTPPRTISLPRKMFSAQLFSSSSARSW